VVERDAEVEGRLRVAGRVREQRAQSLYCFGVALCAREQHAEVRARRDRLRAQTNGRAVLRFGLAQESALVEYDAE
jgi:hypothetical protein